MAKSEGEKKRERVLKKAKRIRDALRTAQHTVPSLVSELNEIIEDVEPSEPDEKDADGE